jgi:tartrate dehydratase alpha subunit/fumarate hydratase class I-like protein
MGFLPAEDPLYKNISLDFFQSNIIKNINVNKTFGANLSGDNSGANIDISSKEVDNSKILSVSAGAGVNTNAISAKDFEALPMGLTATLVFLKRQRQPQ